MLHFFKYSWIAFAILSCLATDGIAQEQTFVVQNPLEITPSLSGNFGELRPNHFHAGLDLKTAGMVGLPVHAAAAGYVSRIKISPYGYGKAVYITHPDGYTTVYGHLDKLNDSIARYARRIQYEQSSFSIDVFPGIGDLPVKDNQIIAQSGNTGGSGGPHLHFEVRETESEVPRNPLLFGFPLSDTKSPIIQAIAVAPLSPNSKVNKRSSTQHFRFSGGTINGGNPIKVEGNVGIELSGFDQQDGSSNHNGIFEVECIVYGISVCQFRADSIPFDQSRYMNALIDYGYYYRTHQRFMRLYRLPGNVLDNVEYKKDGVLKLDPGIYDVVCIARDFNQNETKASFKLNVETADTTLLDVEEIITWNSDYYYESERYRIHLPSGSLYENQRLHIRENEESIEFLSRFTPLHTPVEVRLYKETKAQGEIIALLNSKGIPYRALQTKRDGNWLIAESKTPGNFGVTQDKTKPVITLGNFRNGMYVTDQRLTFGIKDNLSGIEDFSVHIDGKWVLAEYEPKQSLLLVSNMEIPTSEQQQDLLIKVRDMAGNVATFEGHFYKK